MRTQNKAYRTPKTIRVEPKPGKMATMPKQPAALTNDDVAAASLRTWLAEKPARRYGSSLPLRADLALFRFEPDPIRERLTFHEVMAEERAARTRMIEQAPVLKCFMAPVVDGTLVMDEPVECEIGVHELVVR
jgi:hypothetical protein